MTTKPLTFLPWWDLPQPTDPAWAQAAGRVARAAAVSDPDTLFTTLAQACADLVGWRLFTVLAIDHRQGLARRAYTSDPDAYPVGGSKPFRGSELGDTAFTDGRAFIAHTPDELARVFPDHQTIIGLGCGSALNIPVRNHGQVLGSVNLLDQPMHYQPSHAAVVGPLAQLTAATLSEVRLLPAAQ